MSVVRAAGTRRARDPVGGESAVGDVVVDSAPEERSARVLVKVVVVVVVVEVGNGDCGGPFEGVGHELERGVDREMGGSGGEEEEEDGEEGEEELGSHGNGDGEIEREGNAVLERERESDHMRKMKE